MIVPTASPPTSPGLLVLAPADGRAPEICGFPVSAQSAAYHWTASKASAEQAELRPVIWAGSPMHAAAWLSGRRNRDVPPMHAMPMDDSPELLVRWAHERLPQSSVVNERPRIAVPTPPEATVMLVPARHGWEIPALLGWGGEPNMPTADEHAAIWDRWHHQYGAEPFLLGPNFVDFVVTRPPLVMADAEELAWHQYLYAPLVLNNATPSLSELAAQLCGHDTWRLCWDTAEHSLADAPGAAPSAPVPAQTHDRIARPAQAPAADQHESPAQEQHKSPAQNGGDPKRPVNAKSERPVNAKTDDSSDDRDGDRDSDDHFVKRAKKKQPGADGSESSLVINAKGGGGSRYLGKISETGFWSMIRHVPTAMRIGLSLGWQADRGGVFLIVLVQFIGGVAQGMQLLFISQLMRTVFTLGTPGTDLRALIVPIAVLAGSYSISSLADSLVVLLRARVSPRVGIRTKEQLLKTTSQVEILALEDSHFSDDLQAANRGADSATGLFGAVVTVIGALGRVAAALAVLGLMNLLLVPLMVIAVVPKAVAAVRMARISYTHYSNTIQQSRRSSVIFGYLTSNRSAAEVRTFDMAEYLLKQWRELMLVDARDRTKVEKTRAKTGLSADLYTGIANVVVFGFMMYTLISGMMSMSAAGSGLLGIMILRSQTTMLVMQMSGLYEKGLYAREYRTWLRAARSRLPKTGNLAAPPRVQEIRVENVTFKYPGAERAAINNVSMTLRHGETIALVGENGSGKTTLAKILSGLYAPPRGRVLWDGVDSAEMSRKSLWKHVALIPQSFTRWPFTAELNIGVGNLDRYHRSGADSVVDAARMTGAHSLINSLKDGYDTVLGGDFKGSELSGGQWQRLAITRAVYRDASIVIADEPSAALDARAENELFELLQGLKEDRILLLITHRLSSVRTADRIFVLKDGEVIQQGTHEELIAESGLYNELYTMQAESFGVTADGNLLGDDAANGVGDPTGGQVSGSGREAIAPAVPVPAQSSSFRTGWETGTPILTNGVAPGRSSNGHLTQGQPDPGLATDGRPYRNTSAPPPWPY